MMKIKKNLSNNPFLYYGLTAIILFALCSLFPFSGDDWAWGSQIGIDRLNTWFDNYNGRYVGNIIVLALTRNRFLRNVVMSGTITGIIAIICEMTSSKKRSRSFFIICTLLVFMPIGILSSGFVWTSGFSNYATSVFLTLIYVYFTRDIYIEQTKNSSILVSVLLLILGLCNALIVEHFSFFNVVYSIWVIAFCLFKYKKAYIQHIAYLFGSVLGTVIMLSNSVYKNISNGMPGAREISSENGILYRMIANYAREIVPRGFLMNTALLIMIAIVCIIICIILRRKFSSYRPRILVALISTIFIVIYAVISVAYLILNFEITIITCFTTALYVLSLIAFVFSLPIDFYREKIYLLLAIGCAGCSMLPLFFVLPVGSRCFVGSYVFFTLFIAQMFKIISDNAQQNKIINMAPKAFALATMLGLVYLFTIYANIYSADKIRIEKAQSDCTNQSTIYVSDLPYEEYVWIGSVDDEVWNERFKLFYGIPEDVTVIATEYQK